MTAIRQVIEQGLYKDALSVLMWILSFKTPEQKRDHLKMLHQDFITSEYVTPPASDGHVLFIRSLERKDYAALFGAIFQACSGAPKTYFESFKKSKVKHNAKAAAYLESNIDLEDWIEVRDPLDRQCAFMLLINYCYLLEFYADVKLSAVVSFSDMQPLENLFVQYFRSKRIPTVSAQHGLYIDYGEYKTINTINYMNHAADYFLAWGETTAELISAYHPEAKIVMCGKPLVFQDKPNARKGGGRFIMLILDQAIFNDQNHAMSRLALEYAKKHDYCVTVRFHPSLNKEAFLKEFPEIIESHNLSDADIIIGHTSSLLFEALSLRKKAIQYKTEIPSINLPTTLQFKDLSSLKKAIAAPIEPDLARPYFCALNNKSKQCYAEFFKFLLDDSISTKVNFYNGAKGKQQPHDWYISMQQNFFETLTTTAPQSLSISKLPDSEHLPPLANDRLEAIVIPCLSSDLPTLDFIFSMWSTPQFAPSLAGRKVNLLLVFNRLDDELRLKALETLRAYPKLSFYFNDLQIESADLIEDRDLYVKTRSRDIKGKFGNIAGPNFLFQSAMNYAARFGGYAFQMEVDCFPLTPGWIEALDDVIRTACGAWVIGAMYNGDFAINQSVRLHFNGNALYKTGDPKFIGFINEIWIPRLLSLAKELPNLAYDCWWSLEIERSKTNDLSPDSSWSLTRRYNSFFYNHPFIINLLNSDPLEERFAEHFNFYESVGKPPIFLHYAHCKNLAERVLAEDNESLLNLLLPSKKFTTHSVRINSTLDKKFEISTLTTPIGGAVSPDCEDFLVKLATPLYSANPAPWRCRIFLLSCATELLLRQSECSKRISTGGDLETPLAIALEHNTDKDATMHFKRIFNRTLNS